MMTTNEIKTTLADKLQSEGTYFRKSDISVKSTKTGYRIVIKDYEHIPFTVTLEEDDYFGKCVYINTPFDEDCVVFNSATNDYPLWTSILSLGYYIGSRF